MDFNGLSRPWLGLIGQETTGVGGFFNALRTIPVALEIAREMESICPQAWLVNFTNPSGIITEAVQKHSGIKCIGLCNVPINMIHDVAQVLGADQRDVQCSFVGLNHLSFITDIRKDGEDVTEQIVQQLGEHATMMKNIPKVEGVGELTRRLGMIPSPYLQYYFFEEQMRRKQSEEWEKKHVSRAVEVARINERLFSQYENVNVYSVPEEVSRRGGSLYSFAALDIIEALAGVMPRELVVNTRNDGAIEDLLDDDVVETNCVVGRNQVETRSFGRLPPQVSGLIQAVKQYERLTIRAAVEASEDVAVCALLNHPLVHGFENAQKAVEVAKKAFPDTICLH